VRKESKSEQEDYQWNTADNSTKRRNHGVHTRTTHLHTQTIDEAEATYTARPRNQRQKNPQGAIHHKKGPQITQTTGSRRFFTRIQNVIRESSKHNLCIFYVISNPIL
jgi:hypothetical protein